MSFFTSSLSFWGFCFASFPKNQQGFPSKHYGFFVLTFVVFTILNTKYKQITDFWQEENFLPLFDLQDYESQTIVFGLKKQLPALYLRQPEIRVQLGFAEELSPPALGLFERLCKASAETYKLVCSGYAEPPPKVHVCERYSSFSY